MAYPSTGNPITEWLINGTWTDLSSKVRQEDGSQGIVISRGRQNEQGRVSPSSSDFKVNNRDGLFTNRNPSSTYYGLLPLGTQVRHSAGTGDTYLRMPSDDQSVADRLETSDKAALDIVGDIEVRVDAWPDSWRPGNSTLGSGGLMVLASKWLITGNQRSWVFYLSGTGKLGIAWSPDGTSGARITSESTVAVPATSGRLSVKVTLKANNGAAGNTATFYTASSLTGVYTQLGSAVITAGTTSIFSSSAKLCFGGGDDSDVIFSGGRGLGGRLYGGKVYNGIAGTEVADPDLTARTVGATSFVDSHSNTYTVNANTRITSDRIRFWGEVASMPQYWDKSATDVYLPVQAGGIIRRLTQGGTALRSPMYRQFKQLSGIVGYWTLEDGATSQSAANVYSGGQAALTSAVTFNSGTAPVGASSSVAFSSTAGTIVATPAKVAGTGTLSFMVWMKISAMPASQKTLITLLATGTARRIEIGLDATTWHVDAYDLTGGSLYSTSTAAANILPTTQWIGVNVLLATSGGNVNVSVRWLKVDGTSTFAGIGPTSYAGTLGGFTQVSIKAGGEVNYNGAQFSHLMMSNADINFVSANVYNAANAYINETAASRMARLAAEEGVALQIDGFYAQTPAMGYQTTSTFMDLIYECSDADMGILCEARDALALSYRTRLFVDLHRDVTLSMTSSHLAEVPLPTEDDQAITNDVTVTTPRGSSARYSKTTGARSTATPPSGSGTYATSVSVNLAESGLLDAAGWLVHMGTVDEARYPRLTVGMHRTQITGSATLPELLRALDVGWTALLSGMPSWMPPDSVPLLVQGYSETLLKSMWTITANTSPGSAYNTARYDYDDAVGTPRYDTSGSTLSTGITTTGTTVVLAYSTTGDNWTTTSGSYPFDIMLGGEQITLNTAPGGSTSPQTFTGVTRSVNGVVKAHLVGESAVLVGTRYYAK